MMSLLFGSGQAILKNQNNHCLLNQSFYFLVSTSTFYVATCKLSFQDWLHTSKIFVVTGVESIRNQLILGNKSFDFF